MAVQRLVEALLIEGVAHKADGARHDEERIQIPCKVAEQEEGRVSEVGL
jgi:hypothetical protein